MLASLLAQVTQAPFDRPLVDWHALAPEIVVVATAVVIGGRLAPGQGEISARKAEREAVADLQTVTTIFPN